MATATAFGGYGFVSGGNIARSSNSGLGGTTVRVNRDTCNGVTGCAIGVGGYAMGNFSIARRGTGAFNNSSLNAGI